MNENQPKRTFAFEISLSVLNHLGRNLYRSFLTVLGEAISNSWDADASNVYLYVDRDENSLVIKDDGSGMEEDDFQNKFLKIGYSKRKDGDKSLENNRPFIGRKGIGKLALLSCATRITIISKKLGGSYVGGTIDNSGLDKAITEDLTPEEYPLEPWNIALFGDHIDNHKKGTIILFQDINEGIRHSLGFLRKLIALYFRFSLVDKDFAIYFNDEKITIAHLDDLAKKTEFLWVVNEIEDPYVDNLKELFKEQEKTESKSLKVPGEIYGFVASVRKPKDLKITTTEERVGVDLFVNGRLREKNVLKHIPTARVVENYLYGQIHYNGLDDDVDRFTSSREGVVADDPKYSVFLSILRDKIINVVLEDWDAWRIKHRQDGDPENKSISKKERKAGELYNAVSDEYTVPEDQATRKRVDAWVHELAADARFNLASYAECFISENLIRTHIEAKKISLSKEAEREIEQFRNKENDNKNSGNISIEIRRRKSRLGYLSMDGLANLVDKRDPVKEACLARDAKEYKPIRDGLAHTALLTDEAKAKLSTVYNNIKGRVREMFEEE